MVSRTTEPSAAGRQVENSLFRALAVLRVVVLGYAVALNLYRLDDFEHPVVAVAVTGAMALWTGAAIWAYASPARRGTPVMVVDVAVVLVVLALTPYVQGEEMVSRQPPSLATYWVMVPILVWAVWRGWLAGFVAALAVSVVDLSIRASYTPSTYGNVFLLLLGGAIVGYTTTLLREQTEAREKAEIRAAGMAERARLARAVHDGVLQVLTLVQRRGLELGGQAAELGRLAGEQEIALRSLVQGDATAVTAPPTGEVDLVATLTGLQSRTVTVSGPGKPVQLPGGVVDELGAVARACLDNVARHVGAEEPAWVLVEDLGTTVVVTVRDEGPGIPDGRLEEARAEGRLGVCESVQGRLRDLGGSAALFTGPGLGTEWELTVPRVLP